MANEFLHTAVGAVLTQAEFELADGTSHSFNAQAIGDMLYASTTTVLRRLAIAEGVLVGSQDSATIPAYSRNLGSGKWYINDTANANLTHGLTINQGAATDQILSFKSSDIAHALLSTGLYVVQETDDFAVFAKRSATLGGLAMQITAENGAIAQPWTVGVFGGQPSTTHTGAGTGAITLDVAAHAGGGTLSAHPANSNLFTVASNSTTRFIVDLEGDLFADGSDVTVYDEHDDVALIRAYDLARAKAHDLSGVIRSEWDGFITQHEDDLIALGILGGKLSEGGLTNYTRLAQLHNGALWQLSIQLKEAVRRLTTMEAKLLPAGGGL